MRGYKIKFKFTTISLLDKIKSYTLNFIKKLCTNGHFT